MARHADPTNVPDNDYFVITTNVDHCFQKAGFDKKRLFYTQGDYGLFQCSEPCCQETFDNEAAMREMVKRQQNMKVPTELLPVCPHCGKPMTMNLRCDNTFVEDEGWHKAAERYENFLRTRNEQKILFLELGVGYNTPTIVKYSFWRMAGKMPLMPVSMMERRMHPTKSERSPFVSMEILEKSCLRFKKSQYCS